VNDGPVSADVARVVRLLGCIGITEAVIEAVTGCPKGLVVDVLGGELGGEYDVALARADVALVAAVDQARALTRDQHVKQEESAEQTAQWLAEQSDHPRYTQVTEGWRSLLSSPTDVDVAFTAATKRLGDGPGFRVAQQADELRAARDLLHRIAKAAQEEAEPR
jgi:hypothetical protein